MKKAICLLLCAVLSFSLIGCGGGKTESGAENKTDTAAESRDAAVTSDSKTLVVYFSATGNTKEIAKTISDYLNADIFEIVPEVPYTDSDLNWNDKNSRVSTEHSDESKRVVSLKQSVPNGWEQYDTVFIGYPIWWGIAAWPINGFISANDFTGKTVIPFCSSASSGIGESDKLLKKAAGAGNWKSGQRFSSGASKKEIEEWLKSIT